jgi:Fungal specific transcription factor domain
VYQLSTHTINRYFQDFHQFLPILDSKFSPNHVYERSLLLFWAIIGVACRTYAKDPTLLDSLGDRVLNICLLSLRTPTIANIKGLLLVLTWPLSKTPGSNDMTYAISGSILHMAMQIGLHIPTSSQDFSRVKVNLTEAQIVKRAELWGYCIVTYQRSCSFKGYSPLAVLETYQDSDQRHTLFQRINHSLRFQLRLNGVMTRCSSALLQNGLRVMSKDQEHALEILIRVFEATLKDVEPEALSGKLDAIMVQEYSG